MLIRALLGPHSKQSIQAAPPFQICMHPRLAQSCALDLTPECRRRSKRANTPCLQGGMRPVRTAVVRPRRSLPAQSAAAGNLESRTGVCRGFTSLPKRLPRILDPQLQRFRLEDRTSGQQAVVPVAYQLLAYMCSVCQVMPAESCNLRAAALAAFYCFGSCMQDKPASVGVPPMLEDWQEQVFRLFGMQGLLHTQHCILRLLAADVGRLSHFKDPFSWFKDPFSWLGGNRIVRVVRNSCSTASALDTATLRWTSRAHLRDVCSPLG